MFERWVYQITLKTTTKVAMMIRKSNRLIPSPQKPYSALADSLAGTLSLSFSIPTPAPSREISTLVAPGTL
jgi:hypothetical protein